MFETGSLTKPGTNQFIWTGLSCLHLSSNGLQMCCHLLCECWGFKPRASCFLRNHPPSPHTPTPPHHHLSPLLLFLIAEFDSVLVKCFHTNTVPFARKGRSAEYCGKILAQCSHNHSASPQATALPEAVNMLTETWPQPSDAHGSVNWATEVEPS